MKILFFILLYAASLFAQDFQKYFPRDFSLRTAPVVRAIRPAAVQHGSRETKKIALTFDACANIYKSKFDSTTAGILIRNRIPATIFVSGKWALEHRESLLKLAKDSLFEFGNHSFIHPHCTTIPMERFSKEIDLTQNILYTITGKTPVVFRAPYGEYNDSMLTVLGNKGITLIEYDLASGDPDTNATKRKLIEYVSRKAKNGSIVVMHINKRGWHTAEALPGILEELKKKNFEFVTVSELIAADKKEH